MRIFQNLSAIAMVGLLAACGGSSDGYHGADASGIWFGYWATDGSIDPVPFVVIARSDTSIYIDSEYQLLIGTGQTSGTAFSATAMGYQYGNDYADGTSFSMTGEVAVGSSLHGAHSRTGVSGTFGADYDPVLSKLVAAPEAIASTYNDVGFWVREGSFDGSMIIHADGSFTGSGGGCLLEGDISVLDRSGNIYEWTAMASGCTVNGEASGVGFGISDGGTSGFYLVGRVGGSAIAVIGTEGLPATAMQFREADASPRSDALRTLLFRRGKAR